MIWTGADTPTTTTKVRGTGEQFRAAKLVRRPPEKQRVKKKGDVTVTTTDAVTAKFARGRRALAFIGMTIVIGLGGCSTSTNLLGTDSTIGQDSGQLASAQKPVQVAKKIAIPDVIGAPEVINRGLVQYLANGVKAQNLAVSTAGEKPDYTLRGYMVAAKERKGTKVSYIWDLTDQTGNKLKRITGEEVAPKTKSADPWTAVTQPMLEKIANTAISTVATTIPSGAPVASSAAGNQVVATNTSPTPVSTTTGSIARQDRTTAAVIPVTGAPGDGNIALTQAMRKALLSNGVTVENNPAIAAYRIEGVVTPVGAPQDNKQAVQLVWTIKDANGNNQGGLQQDNNIDLATLNGKWGLMAEDAASAAAQGLIKLLPGKQAQKSY